MSETDGAIEQEVVKIDAAGAPAVFDCPSPCLPSSNADDDRDGTMKRVAIWLGACIVLTGLIVDGNNALKH